MTPAFARYVQPARARPQIWRLVLGLVLAAAVYASVAAAVLFAGQRIAGHDSDPWFWLILVAGGESPVAVLTLLATFLGMALGPMAAVRLLHRRSAATLFGPRVRVLRDFATAALTMAAIYAPVLAASYLLTDTVAVLPPGTWLTLLPLALAAILLQTGAEELLFRGYLLQQLAARFAAPLIWALGPALLFGIGHLDGETYGNDAWWIVAAATLFGLFAADLTARTGSLGAAWGFHFANNCAALLFVATEESLYGLALVRSADPIAGTESFYLYILADMAILAIGWLAIRRLVAVR